MSNQPIREFISFFRNKLIKKFLYFQRFSQFNRQNHMGTCNPNNIQRPLNERRYDIRYLPLDSFKCSSFYDFKCSSGNKVIHLCCSQSCKLSAFICSEKNCQCYAEHFQCRHIIIESLQTKLETKRECLLADHKKIFDYVIKKYKEAINKLQKELDQFVQRVNKFDYTEGMQKTQALLVKYIKEGNYKQITGGLINKVQTIPASLVREKSYLSQDQLKAEGERQKIKLQQLCQSLKSMVVMHKVYQPLQSTLRQVYSTELNSKITNNNQLIKGFFGNKTPKFKLLYRASENNFEVCKFHQKCDGISHTLVLALTEFNKIIGGYSPLSWKSTNSIQPKSDTKSQSFLFSVTNSQKYPMVNTDKTIYCHSGYGPMFGAGRDLRISDKGNINKDSYADFPTTYNNGKYVKNQESYRSFSGATNGSGFKVKEWQVFEVQLI